MRRGTRTSDDLPLVLVVDDEVGSPELLAAKPQMCGARDLRLEQRAALCQRFGLLPLEGQPTCVEDPVARAGFVSGLCWAGESETRLDEEAVLGEIERLRHESPPGPALVLLDLQFEFGPWSEKDHRFSVVSVTFGADVVLPMIHERYGADITSPGGHWTALPVVVLSALPKDEVDEIVRRRGARGMLPKRGDESVSECRDILRRYIEAHGLLPDPAGRLVGESLPFLNALAGARRGAAGASSILILGESGTGKELLARYVHEHSRRRDEPYLVYYAAGRVDDLQEDELFGHWQGAFTGATSDRPGLLEEAAGGCLFIDEVGDLAPRVQNALMRPLQERITGRMGRPRHAGQPREIPFDVLFLFATNKDLHELARSGEFKPDLLERIDEVAITLPPLRERPGDVPVLASLLLDRIDAEIGGRNPQSPCHRLDRGALALLEQREYRDGNVRELRNLLLKAALANSAEARLTAADFGHHDLVRMGEAKSVAARPTSSKAEDSLAALARWLTGDPGSLTLADAAVLRRDLAGAAPALIVALLEVAYRLAATSGGSISLPRMVEYLWGTEKLSSQQARRALLRLLQVEWHEGRVAKLADQSSILRSDPRLASLIASAASRRGGGDG